MSEVELKRKVTLKSKDGGDGSARPPKKPSMWKLWVFLGVIIVGAIIFFVNKCSSGNDSVETPSAIEQPSTVPVDETQGQSATTNDAGKPTDVQNSTASGEQASDPTQASVAEQAQSQPETPETVQTAAPTQSQAATSSPGTPSNTRPLESRPNVASPLTGGLDEKALQVIRGNFGNGVERKQNLGSDYDAIQRRVNEMYRDGMVM